MHSVHAGMWDPRPPSKHASPVPAPPSSGSRLSHVTTATPAKRITFYKSGDSQFGGIRMAIHRRSFKCFDALLDDLSQKVPLPFGVRTVTTPRGTHAIKQLEQLQDGACYLCSDRRQAKPINMELASKRPANWYHHSRRPQRPETSSTTPPGHVAYRQRRILLVKNSEPGMRRSVVLSRRSTRSLRAFLDEVSEVMQFHVRKLYTAEGRRIDSVQSLTTCPGVLVCVGREAFSPLLIHFIRKSSEEKLPGLGSRTPGNGARSPATQGTRSPPHGAQSRASECSDGHESKKNVNFGLETKKSIIHPRSDSSNRSTRFSLSSDKSCGNGVAQARPAVMNDDIEKRVLVNKDGSLSVEMRVRFRLHNDETLQWSTQIKKSPSLTNDSCPLSQAEPHYLQQGQSESCSDPDSMSFDPEHVDYSSQPLQHALDTNRCPCCYQRQELQYDLWENPALSHKQPPVPPPHPHTSSHTHTILRHTHSSSSSSSCNSRRVVRCRAQLSSCRAGSGSGQSQVVQEEMCVTEQVEHSVNVERDGDAHVEMCTVSQSCSRSEALAMDGNRRPLSSKSAEEEVGEEEGERPVSAVSSSSHILQSLKEDQDDEDDELPPSASQCCHCSRTSASPASQVHPSDKRREDGEDEGRRAASQQSPRHRRTATPHSAGGTERASSSRSRVTRAKIPNSEEEGAADDEDEDTKRVVSGLSAGPQKSRASSVCSVCGGCKQGLSSVCDSRASQRSHHSHQERPPSESSAASHKSNRSHQSNCNGATGDASVKGEERCHSARSAQSSRSAKSGQSNCTGTAGTSNTTQREQAEGDAAAERAISASSAKSGVSATTRDSAKSRCQLSPKAASPSLGLEQGDMDTTAPKSLSVKSSVSEKCGEAERPNSNCSAKSAATAKSGTSHKSTCSRCVRSPGVKVAGTKEPGLEGETEVKERPVSAVSAKSNLSVTSNKSRKSNKASERPEAEIDGEERAASQTSARTAKSNTSVKSSKSCKSNCNGPEAAAEEKENESEAEEQTEKEEQTDDGENVQDRAASVLSGTSAVSAESHGTDAEGGGLGDRTPSGGPEGAQESKHTAEASVPHEADGVSQEVARCSSQSSTKTPKSVSPSNNVVTIKTPEGSDERETTERAASEASKVSSRQSNHSRTTDVPADAEVVEDKEKTEESSDQMLSPRGARSPRTHLPKASAGSHTRTHSPGQPLLPGGDTRGPSSLSVKSTTSAKSGRGKCRCGASLAKKDGEGEDGEAANKGEKEEPTTERAASIMSSASKKQRRGSGGTEQALSRNSLESVSLCLPDDQESDSGKSSTSVKASVKCPDYSKSLDVRKHLDETGSTAQPPPAVDIPTIETPGESKDEGEEAEKRNPKRTASANSTKSSRCSCKCQVKAAAQNRDGELLEGHSSPASVGNDLETESVKSSSATAAANLETARKRASSTGSGRKNAHVAAAAAEDSADNGTEAAKEADDVTDGRPRCLRRRSAASSQSKKSKGQSPVTGHNSKSTSGSSRMKTPNSVKSPSKVETCSESPLSHSLSAADLLRETVAAARPRSCQSKASKASDRVRCQRNRRVEGQREEPEVTPACLPNASPSDVVSEWLRRIPADSSMLAPDDERRELTREDGREEEPAEEAAKREEEPGDGCSLGKEEKTEAQGEEEKEGGAERDAAEEETGGDAEPVGASRPNALLLSGAPLARNWHSSAAVMKVLLSSSLGRCHSLPEVSPVYGRRLSTSARGLLDCLAQLQLIEPAAGPGRDHRKDSNQQYQDIMAILQSLWLTEAKEAKEGGGEQVSPPRSSSGVDMSSGSAGSGKENGNHGDDETAPKGTESIHEDEEAEKAEVEEEGENADEGDKEVEVKPEETPTEMGEQPVQSREQGPLVPSLDSPKATGNPSSSDKSSANDGSKSPTDNEQEMLEDTSSGTPPTVLRAPLTKRLSQDPDPVWILHLLKKLEKQFISHYIDAMAEFRVRWDLDDSLILNTMIKDLRDEVSRRIQSSIEREMRKIQSRAGRTGRSPRPPQGRNLSRESTMTEKRRRMLKVMKNQSVKTADSFSDEDMTGDFSDQRSDDDYCPCDACVRKKMAARPLKTNPMGAEAPVMMEFDLLKILQLKKSPSPADGVQPVDVETDEKETNLEVVQEEEEEDETKAEAGEEEEESGDEKEGNGDGDEEEEEGDTGEEVQEEEVSGNGEQEDEEGEAECHCHSDRKDEESDQAGEGENAGTGDDEEKARENDSEEMGRGGEEADKETAKEATAAEDESTENAACEDEEAQEPGREGGEEETSGEAEDDGAASGRAAVVEEAAEGNVAASAEAEDAGEEGGREDETGGETEEQEASEAEQASPTQGESPAVCATEGEEADAEDSDADCGRVSAASAGVSGCEAAGPAADEEEREGAAEDAGEEGEEEVSGDQGGEGALLHQFTRTSVESQPGSLEDVDTDSPHTSVEMPKASAPPDRTRRHNPKTPDS